MAGFFVFDTEKPEVGFSTGDDLALNIFLDILTDTMYYTDGSTIFAWEGGSTNKEYTWKSGKLRFPREVNLGAALVEANTFVDVVFKLYADGTLKHTQTVTNGEPFRLPGGYLSNIYEIELIGTDVVTGVAIAETVFDLAAG
jgi:hypothetical protein